MQQSYDVLVVGGGVVGLSAAIAMQMQNLSVAVMDANEIAADLSKPDARVYAINQASKNLFNTLGVWAEMQQERLSPYRSMYIWDAQNGAHIDFNARMVGDERLGNLIEESVIKAALLKRAQQTGVSLLSNHAVTNVQAAEEVMYVTCNESSYKANLLIVADGANSKTRGMLGVKLVSWPYHHHAIVARIAVEKPHKATAYQVFNSDGPLAFLPLNDPYQCSIVWSTHPDRAKQLVEMDDLAFNQAIAQGFHHKLGSCQVLDQRYQFPLTMRHTSQYHGKRWLLMGDCAHTIHPLAGLGLNVGLADVSSWMRIVEQAKGPIWSDRYLSAYQRERKSAVWKTIAMMQALKTIFSTSISPASTIRGIGLQLCNRISPIKRFFIEQAAG